MDAGAVLAGRFEIEARAAAGGMGTIYRAHDRVTNARVAVKILGHAAGNAARRFAREADVLAGLAHDGIVRYVARGQTPSGDAFLAMEWLEGEDLEARLARGPLGVEETLALGRRLSDALGAAHALGVVHRDIKPSNVLLVGGDPRAAKIVDFGIARIALATPAGPTEPDERPLTRTGILVGTVGYMAPEQARGERDVDARADVFSLGCVLFECLTGQPAFSGSHVVAVLAKILLEDAPRAAALEASVPAALDDAVARLLSRDPTDRPADARAVSALLDGTPSQDSPTSATVRKNTFADREQRLVTFVVTRASDPERARAIAQPFGGEPWLLADGTLLVAFSGAHDAAARMARAAACALALHATPGTTGVALATGRVETTGEGRLGAIVDRVAALASARGDRRGIAIDETSAGLLEGRFDVRSEDGVLVLHDTLHERLGPRTLLGRATPCVGRDKELALLGATFEECVDEPVARAVLVTGAAGAGKSRLVHEVITRIEERGHDVRMCFARADPVGAGAPLALLRQLVRGAARVTEGAPREALSRHLEGLMSGENLARVRDLLSELLGAPSQDPSPELLAARNDAAIMAAAVRSAVVEWLGALATREPVLLVLEDIQWADSASLTIAADALVAHAQRPLMVIGVARPGVHDDFPRLWLNAGVQEIRLPALTRSAAERLARAVLPEASDALVARVVMGAEGNAFHLEELLRHVARGGDAFPETLLAVAQSRIETMDPDARRVLRVASIYGDVFWVAGVRALVPDVALEPIVRALVSAELVVERSQSRRPGQVELAFRHSLVREAAYSMLADDDRASGHRLAGAWLEAVGETDPLVLLEHFERGADTPRMTPHLLAAIDRAVQASMFKQIEELAGRALSLELTGEQRGACLGAVAFHRTSTSDFAEATTLVREARSLLPRGEGPWFAATAVMLSSGFRGNDLGVVPEAVADLVSLERDAQPTGPYGLSLYMLTEILESIGQAEVAETLLERAERAAMSSSSVDPVFTAGLEVARGTSAWRHGLDMGIAVAHVERARRALAEVPSLGQPGWFVFLDGVFANELGEHERGERLNDAAERALAREGATLLVAWCKITRGWSLLARRRPEDAIAEVAHLLDGPDGRHAKALTAAALLDLGRIEEADRLSGEAVRGIENELVTGWVVSLARASRARALVVQGRAEEALAAAVLPTGRGVSAVAPTTILLNARLEAARRAGQDELAAQLARSARDRIDRHAASLDEAARVHFLRLRWNEEALSLARSVLDP